MTNDANTDTFDNGDEERKVSTGGGIGFGWEDAEWYSVPDGFRAADGDTASLVDDATDLALARHKPVPSAACLCCKAHCQEFDGGFGDLIPVGEEFDVGGKEETSQEHICKGCLRDAREFKRNVGKGKRSFQVFLDAELLEATDGDADPAGAVAEELNAALGEDSHLSVEADGTAKRPSVTSWRGGQR